LASNYFTSRYGTQRFDFDSAFGFDCVWVDMGDYHVRRLGVIIVFAAVVVGVAACSTTSAADTR
jgi:hypothetical protein